jgi:putative transposase
MADRLVDGRKFRLLNAIDHYTRECVGIAVEASFPAEKVTAYLDRWLRARGKPAALVLDNGTEFTSNHFDAWAYAKGIEMNFIRPGRPVENALIESFNGKLRDECLNASWFETLEEAKEVIESWRRDYNEERPHSALGNVPPAQYVANLIEWAA